MKPSAAAVLIGLLVALLQPCPARIAASDVPPPPHSGANTTEEGRPQDALQTAGGVSDNAVVSGEEKIEARSASLIIEPTGASSNCTEGAGNCKHPAHSDHPEDPSINASQGPFAGPSVFDEDAAAAVVPTGEEEDPLPAEGEVSLEDRGHEDEEDTHPGLNGIEEASRAAHVDSPHPSSGLNGTSAVDTAPKSSSSGDIPTAFHVSPSPPPSTTTNRSFGSVVEGNHVFPSTPDGGFVPESPKASTNKMAVARDGEESEYVDSQESSTPEVSNKSSETSTTEDAQQRTNKLQKVTKEKMKGKWKGQEERRDEGQSGEEEEEDEGESAEDEEEKSWENSDSVERTTAAGDMPSEYTTGKDSVSLYYRQFTRMESQDFEEPGTTRSYLVVEKSTKVDYSSSSVVSEVYDSESPLEEESTKDPSRVQGTSEARHNESSAISSPQDVTDGHPLDEETSDAPEDMAEDDLEDTAGGEQRHPTEVADINKGKDQESASTIGGEGSVTRVQTAEGTASLVQVSTEKDPETSIPAKISETPREEIGSTTVKQADVPTPPQSTSEGGPSAAETSTEDSGAQGTAFRSTTAGYSPRTSRRLSPPTRQSTTESRIKNEVTYNESVTGSVIDFKANISLTTSMAQLTPSALTTPSTVEAFTKQTYEIKTPSPTASTQTTDQSVMEEMMVATMVSISSTTVPPYVTTEVVDNIQGGGNSINDWSTASSVNVTSTREPEQTVSSPTAPPANDSAESTTMSSPQDSNVTSSTLFTTVQNTTVTDLVIESMSMKSSSEEAVSVTASVITSTESSGASEGITVSASPAEQYEKENKTSAMNTTGTTVQSTASAGNVTKSNVTEGIKHVTEVISSTSGDLHPYEVETKVPPVNIVSVVDTRSSDPGSTEVGANDTVAVQPMSTTVKWSTSLSDETTSSSAVTTKKTSTKTTMAPILIKLNVTSRDGTTSAPNKTAITPSEGVRNESKMSVVAYPAYIHLIMKISWSEMCHREQRSSLKQALAQLISTSAESVLPINRVLLLNFDESCPSTSHGGGSPSDLYICILSDVGDEHKDGVEGATVVHCDAALMRLFLLEWNQAPRPMMGPLVHVKEAHIMNSSLVLGNGVGVPENSMDDNTGVQAAIGISCIAAVCLFLLAALLIIMRRRQRRFNYGQRCTPVSLDAYSLDSVSVREGNRGGRGQGARNGDVGGRGVNGLSKGDGLNDWRASKRSYGNPAFEDDDGEEVLLSKPLNFAALTNAALDEDAGLANEFRMIPKRFHKRTMRRKSRARQRDPAAAAERGEANSSKNAAGDIEDDGLPDGAEEKNRYANVIPLTSTRVRLTAKPSGHLSTYINANYVKGPKDEERFYIACQAPLQSTIEDFWRMIWEQQSKVILMLTNLVENSVEKCADYLPPSEVLDCHRLFGDYQVTLKKREVREKYIVSSLQLKNMESNLWREVTHLWFLGWPDQGVPEEPNQVIAFLIEARSFIKTNPGPTVVHCSPGTGRTGTVIAIDICMREFEQSRMIDVPKVVQQLRRDREGAVQTQQQYAFIYKALSLYATKLTGGAMDSF